MQAPETKELLLELLQDAITLAPVFVPKVDGWVDLSFASYEILQGVAN